MTEFSEPLTRCRGQPHIPVTDLARSGRTSSRTSIRPGVRALRRVPAPKSNAGAQAAAEASQAASQAQAAGGASHVASGYQADGRALHGAFGK